MGSLFYDFLQIWSQEQILRKIPKMIKKKSCREESLIYNDPSLKLENPEDYKHQKEKVRKIPEVVAIFLWWIRRWPVKAHVALVPAIS